MSVGIASSEGRCRVPPLEKEGGYRELSAHHSLAGRGILSPKSLPIGHLVQVANKPD